MKAIPTKYGGVDFRSRLEADWAAHLDRLSIDWQYEVEGYQLSDGSWYLPDFYLPDIQVWLEVKGAHNQRVSKVEQLAADLWAESPVDLPTLYGAPMVLIAQPPQRVAPGVIDEWRAYVHGVRGPGKGYSVTIDQCAHCNKVVFVALWGKDCRACGKYNDFLMEGAWTELAQLEFTRAPRTV